MVTVLDYQGLTPILIYADLFQYLDGEISGADREIEVDDNADEDEDTGEEEDLEEEDDAGPGKDDNGPMYHPRGSRKAGKQDFQHSIMQRKTNTGKVPAVYHSSIRAELLAAAAQLGQYGKNS